MCRCARTLTRTAVSLYSSASASNVGAILWHGPHQTAVKSEQQGGSEWAACARSRALRRERSGAHQPPPACRPPLRARPPTRPLPRSAHHPGASAAAVVPRSRARRSCRAGGTAAVPAAMPTAMPAAMPAKAAPSPREARKRSAWRSARSQRGGWRQRTAKISPRPASGWSLESAKRVRCFLETCELSLETSEAAVCALAGEEDAACDSAAVCAMLCRRLHGSGFASPHCCGLAVVAARHLQ